MPCPPALTLTPPNARFAISRLRSALCRGCRRSSAERATAKPWLKRYSEKEYLRAERSDADCCTVKVGGPQPHNNGGVMPSAKGGEEVESRHAGFIPHSGFLNALPSRTHANAAKRTFCYITPALRALSRLSPLQRGARATAKPWLKGYSEKEYLRAERITADCCAVKVGGPQPHNNGGVMPSAKIDEEVESRHAGNIPHGGFLHALPSRTHANATERTFCYITPALRALSRLSPLQRGARATASPWLKGYSEKEYLRAERSNADRCTVKVGGLHLHNNGGVMPSVKVGEEVESRHAGNIPHSGFLHALPSRTHANAAERTFCYITPALRTLSRLSPLQRAPRPSPPKKERPRFHAVFLFNYVLLNVL